MRRVIGAHFCVPLDEKKWWCGIDELGSTPKIDGRRGRSASAMRELNAPWRVRQMMGNSSTVEILEACSCAKLDTRILHVGTQLVEDSGCVVRKEYVFRCFAFVFRCYSHLFCDSILLWSQTMRLSSPPDHCRLQKHKWIAEWHHVKECWCVMSTPIFGLCRLAHVHTTSIERCFLCVDSASHTRLAIASSGVQSLSFLFFFKFPFLGRALVFIKSNLFYLRVVPSFCFVFKFLRVFVLRVRQVLCSRRFRVDVAFRIHQVAARQTSPSRLTSRSHPAHLLLIFKEVSVIQDPT